jgi:N-acetylneuraminic acid mutarotase
VASWQRLPAAPIVGRFAPAGVWTGRQLLVWGGDTRGEHQVPTTDGAAYDPTTSRWQPIPPAPKSVRGLAPAAVWTGTKLLVWIGNAPDGPAVGATYDPARRSWQTIATSPLGPRESFSTVWTGKELILFGGTGGDTIASPPGAAYNPASNRWRLLPPAPQERWPQPTAVWSGSEMLVWGGHSVVNGKPANTGSGAAYNPQTNRWRPIAKRGRSGLLAAAWTGSRVLVWDDSPVVGAATTGALYDPTRDRWTPIRRGPAIPRDLSESVWTGTELIGWEASNRGVAYNPARDSWRVLPRSPLATHNGRGRLGAVMVWTGTQMVIWGGWTGAFKDAPFPDGAAFQPATL